MYVESYNRRAMREKPRQESLNRDTTKEKSNNDQNIQTEYILPTRKEQDSERKKRKRNFREI